MFVEVSGLPVHYTDEGPSDSLPVIFLHAFPLNGDMWRAQQDFLKASRRVIALDIRGHGKSGGLTSYYFIDHLSDDLKNFMDALNIGKAILCGLSMGGYIALRFIERYPDRCKGLILCDTRAEADANEAKLRRANTLSVIQDKGLSAFAGPFMEGMFSPHTLKLNPGLVQRVRDTILKNRPEAVCKAIMALATRRDALNILEKIEVPTLIVVGKDDVATPVDAAQLMKDKIPGAKMVVIQEAGHLSNLEQPEIFNRTLAEFLAQF